jgi:4-hydroxy-3-methylbut-2-enyl diphosphate reductase
MEVIRYARQGLDIILVGHDNHPEVEGTLGRFPKDSKGKIYLVESEIDAKKIEIDQPSNLAMVTQTTLSVDDTKSIIDILKKRFPKLISPSSDDICYATQNRQDAVKQLALETELIIIVGSNNSSNSNRLKELSENCGVKSILVDDPDEIAPEQLDGIFKLGISAGASAPESLVQSIVSKCQKLGFEMSQEMDGLKESVNFKLPKELVS